MWRTAGHDKAVNILGRALGEGRTAHAYLVTGPEHVGKMTLALDLARAVNCSGAERPCDACAQCRRVDRGLHADVRVVGVEPGPSGGRQRVAIGIDQVREVQREASLKPYEGSSRVFIFDRAERLTEEAANSLLKILEEPPGPGDPGAAGIRRLRGAPHHPVQVPPHSAAPRGDVRDRLPAGGAFRDRWGDRGRDRQDVDRTDRMGVPGGPGPRAAGGARGAAHAVPRQPWRGGWSPGSRSRPACRRAATGHAPS